MTKVKVTHINEISQQLSTDLKELNNLMSQTWVQHELANSRFIDLQNLYKKFSQQINGTCLSSEIKKTMDDFMDISEGDK